MKKSLQADFFQGGKWLCSLGTPDDTLLQNLRKRANSKHVS
jgi:hypothetical protein